MNDHSENNLKNKNIKTLWIMVLLFGLPYIAAYYFYINRSNIDLGVASNYGTIITPVRQIPDLEFKNIENTMFNLSSIKGKWTLLTIGNSQCQEDCQSNIYKIRQIKKAVGEDYKRINKVFFLTDIVNLDSFKKKIKEYKGMEVIVPAGEGYEKFLSSFSVSGEKVEDGIYIVDPLGNYMMAYPSSAEAKGILKDLQRLLKVSRIG